MIKDRLQIARGSAARITSFLNSFRDYEIIFNTDTNRLGIVLPDKTIVYIGVLDINEHNTDTEATHLDIRQEIADLEDDLQEQIEEIDSKLVDKADLVDGKVPLEQLPDVEDVLTGDITSHNHATEIGNHDTSELAHPFLKGKIDEARAIAEGKSRAIVFATKSELDTWLLDDENKASLRIGDNFYIEETDKPDYWWNGTTIKELETQKVDLTEYAKSNDLATVATTGSYNDLTNTPTIPTIPNISITNGTAESGKYISQVAVDETDKHKLVITKADLPQGFSGSYNDLTNKPTIPTVPTISTNITTDALDDTKTASPKAVKDYVDNAISTAIGDLLGGEY